MTPMLANIIQDIFSPLISVFESVLVFFHDSIGLSWGWAIIALTVTVRTVLIPVTYKQIKATQALQAHAPELKALNERYKDDPERKQQEIMKFYKENKVNPFGSCLPLLFQMPVFISLFYMLRTDLRIDICPNINPPGTTNPVPCGSTPESEFFFIPDITNKATGGVLVILIVLYIGSQLASSMIMSVSADRNQRLLMMGLPFVFTIFIISFPAGLILYWITTNFWTVGQSLVVRRMRLRREAEAAAEKAAGDGLATANGAPPGGAATAAALVETNGKGGGAAAPAKAEKAEKAAKDEAKPASAGAASMRRLLGKSEPAPAEEPKAAAPPPPPPRRKKKRSGRRK